MQKTKPTVLVLVQNYPQLSQTYIKTELNTLLADYEIRIVATSLANREDPEHLPYEHIKELDKIVEYAREVKPCLIHGHYLLHAHIISHVAEELGVPFTIRAHSFDAMVYSDSIPAYVNGLEAITKSELCIGVLAFPFTRHFLENDFKIPSEKITDAPPNVDFHAFYNRRPNGRAILNTGACTPKKKMEDFVNLAAKIPSRTFNLYAIGYSSDEIDNYIIKTQSPVIMADTVPFSKMPPVYKQHGWIVYSACLVIKTVGWPMAIIEAQASGVVACMPNIRPDMEDFLEGSAHLYNDIDELIPIIEGEPSKIKREMGFDNARRYDIRETICLLTDLWQPYLR